jgi:Tfp pilus tip-associated adhesin PilY1
MERKMKKTILVLLIIMSVVMIYSGSQADDSTLFEIAQVSPDALILLDMSGSMRYDPTFTWQFPYADTRIAIARKVLYSLLDANADGSINSADEDKLNMRLGYMRFYYSWGDYDNGNPYAGSIRVVSEIGSSYNQIWNNIIEPGPPESYALVPTGATPLAEAMVEVKNYFLNYVNPNDKAIKCRQKYLILVTDGSDTLACNGDGMTTTGYMRMKTVQRVKELYGAGITVFVVGFGATLLPAEANTLNWAAKYGGTMNPDGPYVGDPDAYDITKYLPAGPGPDACYSTANSAELDPANYNLGGYAFMAADATALTKALQIIIKYISDKVYSFSSPTAPTIRATDNNTVYLSSFMAADPKPWMGTFKAYNLKDDGTLSVDTEGNPVGAAWDAAEVLKTTSPDSRKIYVNLDDSSTPKEFKKTIVQPGNLGYSLSSDRDNLVDFIRGNDAYRMFSSVPTKAKPYKLGDIIHSNAVVVGAPNSYYEDEGYNGSSGFYSKNKDRKKVIIVGANDGMLHAFDAGTGSETWAFIPNALLKNLKLMRSGHAYYVDSSPKVSDVWFYSSSTDTNKSWDEWRTVLICGYRAGGNGYFALDITDTQNPKFLWEFPKAADAYKMGESWSEPSIGKVKIEGTDGKLYERWVAFFGGGYLEGEHTHDDPDGRSFFVVDITDGRILWQYYFLDDAGKENYHMRWGLPSPPAAVDTDHDGFIEKVYIGDLGGQMWAFDVSSNEVTMKSNSQWTGKRLFKDPSSTDDPIYNQPAVAFDKNGIPWVFFGTGDRENPVYNMNTTEAFYAVKDDENGTYPYTVSDLTDVTNNNTYNVDPLKKGWYLRLETSEMVLAKPSIFNRIVYFTTYLPLQTKKKDSCSVGGSAKLYFVEFLSGGGATVFSDANFLSNTTSERSKNIGDGVPSVPVITVDTKGQASVIASTTSGTVYSQAVFSMTSNKQVLYWREVIP